MGSVKGPQSHYFTDGAGPNGCNGHPHRHAHPNYPSTGSGRTRRHGWLLRLPDTEGRGERWRTAIPAIVLIQLLAIPRHGPELVVRLELRLEQSLVGVDAKEEKGLSSYSARLGAYTALFVPPLRSIAIILIPVAQHARLHFA